MQIKVEYSGGVFWLAPGPFGVADLRVNNQRVIQVAAYLRARQVRAFNRRNARLQVSFSTTREHESAQAAQEYLLEHEATLPDFGLVVFIAQGARGNETEYYLPGAAIESIEADFFGKATHHQYSLVGGKITRTRPQN